MRVLVDAMCAEFGGIRTYVEQLLLGWAERYPDDEVHVVLRGGSTLATPGLVRHELAVRSPEVVGRPLAQTTSMHRLERQLRPDVVLATAPTTDVRRMRAPLAVVILDLRAEILPEQFSRARRLLRWASYGRSYQLAAGFLAISQRSLDDLHRLHPRTRNRPGVVTHLAADHVLDWPDPSRDGPVIAFAHHTNKNPELLLDAWALLSATGEAPPLTFLGVSGELRPRLAARIAEERLGDLVELSPYLPDDEFRERILAARMIAFPSAFEGFGLPIVEGMLLRKPVVIGPDAGSVETAGGHAVVAEDWTPEALALALRRGLELDEGSLEKAYAWGRSYSWGETIRTTRSALADLADTSRR